MFDSKTIRMVACLVSLLIATGCGGGGGGSAGGSSNGGGGTPVLGGNATGGDRNPVCAAGTSTGEVARPQFRMNLAGQTSWYASPVVADLNGDGQHQLIAAYYSLYVFGSDGTLLDRADGGSGRIYAPHIVVDLEGDGIPEIVYGNGSEVYAYEWRSGRLSLKAGWPVDTTTAGESPEVRGLAAADLDGDGRIEIVATTTQTQSADSGGAQVFVFSSNGALFQPAGLSFPAWPRYNNRTGDRRGRRPQRGRTLGVRLLRAERRHRQHRRR